jgi:hypothetical protein
MTANDDEIGLETPDVDRLEQAQPLADDGDGGDEVTGTPGRPVPGSVLDNIDADEADVIEQSIEVPSDDDYRDGDS